MGRRRIIYSKKTLNAIEKSSGNSKIGLGIFLIALGLIFLFAGLSYMPEIGFYLFLLLTPDIIFGIILISAGISQNEKLKIYQKNLSKANISQVDRMNGKQFEDFVSVILQNLGYLTTVTQQSRDFGADIVVEKNGKKVVIQTKCYSSKVSLKAVQEVYSAMYKYHATECWVVTNNYFTKPAIELAKTNGVILIDRNELINLIVKSQSTQTNKE